MATNFKRKLQQKHLCIRIFKDDTVIITDQDGVPIKPMENPPPLIGPINTYAQALWFNENPTCIWYRGKGYCR